MAGCRGRKQAATSRKEASAVLIPIVPSLFFPLCPSPSPVPSIAAAFPDSTTKKRRPATSNWPLVAHVMLMTEAMLPIWVTFLPDLARLCLKKRTVDASFAASFAVRLFGCWLLTSLCCHWLQFYFCFFYFYSFTSFLLSVFVSPLPFIFLAAVSGADANPVVASASHPQRFGPSRNTNPVSLHYDWPREKVSVMVLAVKTQGY